MRASELKTLIDTMMAGGKDPEIRVGDQIESGPYLHASVGSVAKGHNGELIISANDDEQWTDETAKPGKGDEELPILWATPAALDHLPIG